MTRAIHAPFLLLLLSLLLGGCGEHLAGTHDATLELTVKAPAKPLLSEAHAPKPAWAKPPTAAAGAAIAVTQRLGAMHVTADVEEVGEDKVQVTLDADQIAGVKQLLRWRGGVELDALDPGFHVDLAVTTGLTEKTEVTSDGITERYWEGTREAVAAALAATQVPEGHALRRKPTTPSGHERASS